MNEMILHPTKLKKFHFKNWWKIEKIIRKFYKYVKSGESLENLRNFKINYKNVSKQKASTLRVIKCRPTKNQLNQYFEKILRKIINFHKKFEEQSKN